MPAVDGDSHSWCKLQMHARSLCCIMQMPVHPPVRVAAVVALYLRPHEVTPDVGILPVQPSLHASIVCTHALALARTEAQQCARMQTIPHRVHGLHVSTNPAMLVQSIAPGKKHSLLFSRMPCVCSSASGSKHATSCNATCCTDSSMQGESARQEKVKEAGTLQGPGHLLRRRQLGLDRAAHDHVALLMAVQAAVVILAALEAQRLPRHWRLNVLLPHLHAAHACMDLHAMYALVRLHAGSGMPGQACWAVTGYSCRSSSGHRACMPPLRCWHRATALAAFVRCMNTCQACRLKVALAVREREWAALG